MAREFKLLCVLGLVATCVVATTTEAVPTTTAAPTTTTEAPTTTITVPTTTTEAPTTTTAAPTATTEAPTTTTEAPTTTTEAPTTTTEAPTTTTAAPTTTTEAPTTTTEAPTTTTEAPTTTTEGPTTTTEAPTTTTAGPTTTTEAPTTTTAVATTTSPTTTASPTTTTEVAPTTTAGPTTTTEVVPTTTAGPTTTTEVAPTTTAGQTTTTEVVPTTTTGPTTTTEVVPTTTAGPTTTTEAGKTTTAGPTTTPEAGKTTTAGPTTTTEAGKTTTAGPTTTTEAVKTTTAVPTTTKPPGPCYGSPCGDGSTCLPRHNETFVCSCLAGNYNYGSGTCESAKVFPGQLSLSKLPYDKAMANSTSEAFQDVAQQIYAEMSEVFSEDGYSNCTVLKLQPIAAAKLWSRSEPGILATVEIIFKANVPINESAIGQMLAAAGGVLKDSNFTASNLCDEKKPCDADTAECIKEDGSFSCKCMENYVKTDFSNRMCIACPSGKKAQGSEKCVDCPFGYSGFNCNESWKLSLVIVGSVLGGLLLITVILLPIVACKSSKKSSKKDKNADTGKSYVSHPQDKKPLVNSSLGNSQAASFNGSANGLSAFTNAGVPRIPRATTNNSWDSRTNLEMTQSNKRQNLAPVGRNPRLYDDHNDMNPYAQARPQNGLYAQSRPQNNPYAQTRPQINPYTQNQGHSNPYYVHDDGRRFN
ncbi:mucin-13b isoform X2 [Epinephelus moara]|uniref:mucin-13b isoform X2 n=1 Tax=Epinephelus moara TaxID=300413 RepID=UPI00214F157E|nr:mucin-13b isoform X2 [Epinephelus moara]